MLTGATIHLFAASNSLTGWSFVSYLRDQISIGNFNVFYILSFLYALGELIEAVLWFVNYITFAVISSLIWVTLFRLL